MKPSRGELFRVVAAEGFRGQAHLQGVAAVRNQGGDGKRFRFRHVPLFAGAVDLRGLDHGPVAVVAAPGGQAVELVAVPPSAPRGLHVPRVQPDLEAVPGPVPAVVGTDRLPLAHVHGEVQALFVPGHVDVGCFLPAFQETQVGYQVFGAPVVQDAVDPGRLFAVSALESVGEVDSVGNIQRHRQSLYRDAPGGKRGKLSSDS